MNRTFRYPALLVALLLLSACSITPDYYETIPESDYRERVQTQESDGLRVSAAVPSAKETKQIFGRPLYKRGIQPVWLRIENRRKVPITFLPAGLDPQYYSPLEAAHIDLPVDKPIAPKSLVDQFFLDQRINLTVLPGENLSGFVFTRLDEGTKTFNIDVSLKGNFETFTFFIPVPGLNIDHYEVDWHSIYPEEDYVELDDREMMELIEQFECCVSNKAGTDTGDPLNLVIIGHPREVYVAFIRAGWDETESVGTSSAWKTAKSFISGSQYRYSPVSSLYVFGRAQDVAFQRTRENIHERNHLRLWLAPALYKGNNVWIGQISRDIGVRFTKKTITTHKIDPDVDETREFLLENLAASQALR